MQIKYSLQSAAKSLILHKGRTILTLLGIVIGITTIVIILSAGDGLRNIVLDQLGTFGTDTVFVEVKIPNTSDTSGGIYMSSGFTVESLKPADASYFDNPKLFPNINATYAVQMGQGFATREGAEKSITVFATNPDFITIDKSTVAAGRFFDADEEKSLAKVVVIGAGVKEKLFAENEEAVGQFIKFAQQSWKVVGVMESKGAVFFNDVDKQVYVPLKTYQKLISGHDFVPYFVIQVKDKEYMAQVKNEVEQSLRLRHKIEKPEDDDFRVTTVDEALDMVNTIMGGLNLLLGAIAAISLVVGGIGIMNIMLVSVSERTPEIGLRKAIGATKKNILTQFLAEAILVTVIGGIIGVILGITLTWLISILANYMGFKWAFTISLQAIGMGLAMAFGFGLFFGLYPAWKAAKLDPVQALRKE